MSRNAPLNSFGAIFGALEMGQRNLTSEECESRAVIRLDLGDSQTLQSASDLHNALLEAVDRALPLIIEASSVERFATAAVQLLLATQRTLAERGIAMTIRRPSPVFLNAFRSLGIEPRDQGWVLEEAVDG